MVAKVCEGVACPLDEGAEALPLHIGFSTAPGPYTLLANATREKTLRQVERARAGSSLFTNCLEEVFSKIRFPV
jgi:hypothetical protein